MAGPQAASGWRPPPPGTYQRVRNRSIWAVAVFAASVPPAAIGMGFASASSEQANVAIPLALLFWAIGVLLSLWAAFPTVRYWEHLPPQVRLLGALPMLTISLFLSAMLVGAIFLPP